MAIDMTQGLHRALDALTFVCRYIFGPLVLCACSLPEPDGLEATLIERAENLPELTARDGRAPDAIVRNSLLLSPAVRAAASAVNASADDIRVQRAALFPSLGLSITGGLGDAAVDEASLELRMRQLVVDFGRTKRAVTRADLDLQIAYIDFQQAIDDEIFKALEAYDEVLKNVRLTAIRADQHTALAALHAIVKKQTLTGAVPASDALESLQRLREAEFAVLDAKLSLAEARDHITELTGQPKGGAVPALSVSTCASPDDADATRKARLELARAQLDVETAKTARKPRIFVEPVLRRREDSSRLRTGIDIGVNSDILQGGALTAAVDAAEDTRAGAQATVAATRRTAVLDQNRLKRDLAANKQRIRLLSQQINLLDKTRSVFKSQYLELGTRRVADLLDIEIEYFDRKAELVETKSELIELKLECAIREDQLRSVIGIKNETLYGFPLQDLQL